MPMKKTTALAEWSVLLPSHDGLFVDSHTAPTTARQAQQKTARYSQNLRHDLRSWSKYATVTRPAIESAALLSTQRER